MLLSQVLAMAAVFVAHCKATSNVDFSNWAPPGPGDVRSPCPALNSLANHHILPHNGKDITIPILTIALTEGLNVAPDFAIAIGGMGLLSSNDPLGLSFNLNDLSRHEHMIEHDGSLSRGDAYFGDNHSFNQTIWNTVLQYFQGANTVSFTAAAKARWNRIQTSKQSNPQFTYSAKDLILSYGETSLYLSVLGDPVTGNPPVEWVRSLFEKEKLPYEEGWRPPAIPITLASLVVMQQVLMAAGGEELPEGFVLTENALKKVLAGEPLEALLGNILV